MKNLIDYIVTGNFGELPIKLNLESKNNSGIELLLTQQLTYMNKLKKKEERSLQRFRQKEDFPSYKTRVGNFKVIYVSGAGEIGGRIIMKHISKDLKDYKLTWLENNTLTLRMPLLYLNNNLICTVDHSEKIKFENDRFYRDPYPNSNFISQKEKKTMFGYTLIEKELNEIDSIVQSSMSGRDYIIELYENFIHNNSQEILSAIYRGISEIFNPKIKEESILNKIPKQTVRKLNENGKKLDELINKKLSMKEIAKIRGVKETTIYSQISSHGLMDKYRKIHPINKSSHL